MANNVLIMNLEESEDFEKRSNDSAMYAEETRDKVGTNLKGATDAGVMTKQAAAVQNQLNMINERIESIGKKVGNHTRSMFELEKTKAAVIRGMQKPGYFLAENATKVNEFNRIIRGKIDGDKTVDEGKEAKAFEEIDESVIGAAEKLGDITGAAATEEVYDDDSSIKGESKLGNIKKDEETEEQELDDSSSINQSALHNIINAGTTQQELDAESSIQGQSNLGSIGQFKSTKEQEYDDESSLDENQKLGVAENQKSAKEQQELEKQMMAAAYDNFAANELQEEMKRRAEDELEHVDYNEFENSN